MPLLRIIVAAFAWSIPLLLCAQDGESQPCRHFLDLIDSGNFVEARALYNKDITQPCPGNNFQLALAQLLGAEYRYSEALTLLRQISTESIHSHEIQLLIERFTKADKIMGKVTPVFIRPYVGVNTSGRENIAWVQNKKPVVITDYFTPVQYLPIKYKTEPTFTFIDPLSAVDGKYLSRLLLKLYSRGFLEPGTACYGPDSILILSAHRRMPFKKKGISDRYELLCFDGSSLHNLRFPEKLDAFVAFPCYHQADSVLAFSTDYQSENGNLNIWFSKWTGEFWSTPFAAAKEINSIWNEAFPFWQGDTLFFSSDRPDDGFGGMDVYAYSFLEEKCWNLGTPINSPYNDHSFITLAADSGIMVSDRKSGFGLSDIYAFKWTHSDDYFNHLFGEIVCDEKLTGRIVVLATEDGSILQRSVIGQNGRFALRQVKGLESYNIRFEGQQSDCKSELRIYDADEKLIKQVKAGPKGNFIFELLLPKDYYMQPLELKDESILALDVIGRVLFKDPDVKSGIQIVLTDSEGNAIAKTQTGDDGGFIFESVRPDSEYIIISEGAVALKQIFIVNENGDLLQSIDPGDSGEFVYVRIDDNSKVITLTNEWSQKVRVSEVDHFNLGSILYEYNSAKLDRNGQRALDRVIELMKSNPDVSIELEGHTDSQGSFEFNLKLSERRIQNAMDYLIQNGMDSQRITGKGFGESRPANHCVDGVNCTENEHAVNRRTELRFHNLESR